MDPMIFQQLATGAVGAAIVAAIAAVIQVIFNKKLRSPADRKDEIKTVFDVLNGTIQDNRADRAANDAIIKTLREYADKLEEDSRQDQEMIRTLYQQIHVLEQRNAEKDRRIQELESEIQRYAQQVLMPSRASIADTI